MMKRFSVLAWIIVSLLYISTFAEAHPNIKGREATGWDTLSGHAAGREIKYIIKPGVPDAIVSLITSAASAWNSVCTFSKVSSGHIGEIKFSFSLDGNPAKFIGNPGSGGHYASWTITINSACVTTQERRMLQRL